MKILKKAAPIAAAFMLAGTSLFSNPLESTVIKEDKTGVEFTGSVDTNSFSLDSSLPLGNEWTINFDSDLEYNDGPNVPPRLNNVDLVVGDDHFFAGASFGDLSSDTLLTESNIMKLQTGIRLWDWFDLSVTGARVFMPKFKTSVAGPVDLLSFEFPVNLYALGFSGDIGKEFPVGKGDLSLFPWLSFVEGSYFAESGQTQDLIDLTQALPDYTPDSVAFPFDHLNV